MSWLLVSVGCLFLSLEVESSVFVLPLESAKDMMTGIGKLTSMKVLFLEETFLLSRLRAYPILI